MISVFWTCVIAYVAALGILFGWLIRTQPAAPVEDSPPSPKSDKGEEPPDSRPDLYQKPGPWY